MPNFWTPENGVLGPKIGYFRSNLDPQKIDFWDYTLPKKIFVRLPTNRGGGDHTQSHKCNYFNPSPNQNLVLWVKGGEHPPPISKKLNQVQLSSNFQCRLVQINDHGW